MFLAEKEPHWKAEEALTTKVIAGQWARGLADCFAGGRAGERAVWPLGWIGGPRACAMAGAVAGWRPGKAEGG